MRIVFDARMAFHTGIGRYIRGLLPQLGQAMATRGHRLIALTPPGWMEYGKQVEPVAVRIPPLSFREQWVVPRVLDGLRPDLFHVAQFNLPLRYEVPAVVTVHDCAYDRFPSEFSSGAPRLAYRVLMPKILEKARHIIAVSEATRQELCALYGLTPDRVSVIHHGLEVKFHQAHRDPVEARQRVRNRLALEDPYFLFVGLLRPRKGISILLEAFAVVARKWPGTRLVIVRPPDRRFIHLDQEITRLGLQGLVRAVGVVEEELLLDLYRGAAALLFPSLYEGFGFPVLEAMASGTPVVASDIPAVRELAGEAVYKIPPGDIDALASAILRVSRDFDLRQQLINAGVARARQYSWTRCAADTLAVYEEVAR